MESTSRHATAVSVDELNMDLKSTSLPRRRRAIIRLGRSGAAAALEPLLAQLASPIFQADAARALAEFGAPATPYILTLLTDAEQAEVCLALALQVGPTDAHRRVFRRGVTLAYRRLVEAGHVSEAEQATVCEAGEGLEIDLAARRDELLRRLASPEWDRQWKTRARDELSFIQALWRRDLRELRALRRRLTEASKSASQTARLRRLDDVLSGGTGSL